MNRLRILLYFSLLIIASTEAIADWRGFTTLTTDSNGIINIPVEGGDSYWVILNQCYLDRFGFTKSGQSITYRPRRYGDIFFFQQFSGPTPRFVEAVVYAKLAGKAPCTHTSPERLALRQSLVGSLDSFKIAQEIMDTYETVKLSDPNLTAQSVISRFPRKAGSTCPTDLKTDQDKQKLASCIDVDAVGTASEKALEALQAYPSPALTTDFSSHNYQIRKPFSSSTIKTSVAFVNTENTAVNTAYVSINPFVLIFRREGWTQWVDPLTIDIGLAKPMGDTASERFEAADNHYLFGIGYELTNTFSVHVSHIYSYHDDGKTEGNTAVGISIDLLSLANRFK